LEIVEYLICNKFAEIFLFDTEQFNTLELIYDNNSKEELQEIARLLFNYISSLSSIENIFSNFDKEKIKMLSNLIDSATEGIKENKKLIKFFREKKSNKKLFKIANKTKDDKRISDIQLLNESKITLIESNSKTRTSQYNKSDATFNQDYPNKNNIDKNFDPQNISDDKTNIINIKEKECKKEIKELLLKEDLESIKNRLKFPINNNKDTDDEKENQELIRKNNDFLIYNCEKLIENIKAYKVCNNRKNSLNRSDSKLHGNLNSQRQFQQLGSFSNGAQNIKYTPQIGQSIFLNKTMPILPSIKNHKDYFDIFDWDDTEICKQLTLVTHFIFQQIKFKELINSQWTKIDKKISAPNVYKLIERFNKISLWACEEILSYDKSSMRKLVLDKFINIAYILYKMNNFNDAFSIVTALNSFFIKDLKKTWKRVDAYSSIPKAKELNEIFSHTKNYAKLRELLDSCLGKPCIPFLGLFLKDLSYMDEGQKYIVTKQEDLGLLNLEKIKLVEIIFQKIVQYQNANYDFMPVFSLSFLADPDPISENLLIDLARKLGNKKFV